jgi:hypothetical protein
MQCKENAGNRYKLPRHARLFRRGYHVGAGILPERHCADSAVPYHCAVEVTVARVKPGFRRATAGLEPRERNAPATNIL